MDVGSLARSGRRPRLLVLTAAAVALLVVVGIAVGVWWPGRSDDTPAAPASASAATSPTPTTPASSEPAAAADPMVLIVSVDGLNPDAVRRLGPDATPSLHRLVREGAATSNARTAYELTITLPNHTGMLTGRGVSGADGHGVTFNDDDGSTLEELHGSYEPGVFDVAHDHGLTTAFLAAKDKFTLLLRSWDAERGALDTTGADDGRDKTDIDLVASDEQVVARAIEILRDQRADLTFVHLQAPDHAGHASGWLGAEYLSAVRSVDGWLGEILAAVDASPALRERLTIVLTADHGGPPGERLHDDPTLLANHRIPFVAWGRGVATGADLYDLNPDRRDPGTSRPGYDGVQPVRNVDVTQTVLRLLDLPTLDGTTSSDWPPLVLR